ncbi:pyridoxamine 5'-phosphate oxidase family protein [Bdellovibrio svalbardensis]|uniref:Pyridoxamine 5'-phosphate oxidase family protein n=1 Tax=Bdellovibrio svalbardensis TaxID=2972972 RepID=A0ABT6DK91_9BACT|nr:pyridoxamine 5'-phosphate oxidase family protein [Bdellovibrio svalbardensis]MDG0816334.1 pyridoxamine 5'-phosphate oxidase family protein [Bdellovibrio svalbardensis]
MEIKSQHSSDPNVQKLGELIKHVKIAMLTTIGSDKKLHSSPLLTQEVDFDGDLWFLISKQSQKITDIAQENRTNVSYASSTGKYISVTGFAELVDDKDKVNEIWSRSYQDWFPQGPLDPNIQLLKINVEKAEYWDEHTSPFSRILEFAHLTKSHVSKKSEHGTLDLNH